MSNMPPQGGLTPTDSPLIETVGGDSSRRLSEISPRHRRLESPPTTLHGPAKRGVLEEEEGVRENQLAAVDLAVPVTLNHHRPEWSASGTRERLGGPESARLAGNVRNRSDGSQILDRLPLPVTLHKYSCDTSDLEDTPNRDTKSLTTPALLVETGPRSAPPVLML